MTTPEGWVGRTLKELRLPEKNGVEVVTVKSAGRGIPSPALRPALGARGSPRPRRPEAAPRRAQRTGLMPSAADLKRLAKLKQKKYREAERLFLAEGRNLVGSSPQPPLETYDDPAAVKRLSTLTTPTGPVALFPFLDVPPDELLRSRDLIVLLDGVQDPGNVGTAIRAAHAFGAGVALSSGTADLYNPKTVRATMGSLFHAPVARELDPTGFLASAHAAGFASAAAMPEGGDAPADLPAGKLVLVVGSEGAGLSEEVAVACSLRVTIPVLAPSLNAAVAASILIYEAHGRMLG
ncbi:RNA methyltransferase [Rubrobacter marinus]|uniref:RNA methyltransferase n=1 Tax=Rubrobacter marinus TaxID=2653852 RepID=A0A6G8PXX6_9ACTN|nr:RNA methyltransferase [Rubrobacter marinus]QIN79040.1 RNA methyltransferase [Rubrobacter marinus]